MGISPLALSFLRDALCTHRLPISTPQETSEKRLVVVSDRERASRKTEHTGHVSESVSDQDSVGVLWVVPLQVDGLQVGLSDSETPGGTGYLGKEEGARRRGRGG